MAKIALICGVTGQDGAYLARLLLDRGYEVHGSSRDAQGARLGNLERVGVRDHVALETIVPTDFRSVLQALRRIRPDEVYHLAGQSSVGLSFEQPVETLESITIGTINWLEAIRLSDRPTRLYSAGSGECFGETFGAPATEETPFRPRSPYAVAKAAAFWAVANYREAYALHASTGVLFNHESPLRPPRFVTRKIVAAACRIADGANERLRLGNVSIERDWGWAPDYVDAMWRMLQRDQAEDFVIATGHSYPLSQFVELAFSAVGLDWRDHVEIDAALLRPTDIAVGRADPTRAWERLGWRAQHRMPEVVALMVEAERAQSGVAS